MQHGTDMQVVLTWTEFVKSTDDLVVGHVADHKLSVHTCQCVCLSPIILALQATRRLMSDTNSFSATRA